ncbi:MAG TPA: hypothetical protein VHM70_12135 [Polyangiaceae bacterium]|jgi:hypothetical protein|nr:hypothetical protein [Polyangiaceae bacterium]
MNVQRFLPISLGSALIFATACGGGTTQAPPETPASSDSAAPSTSSSATADAKPETKPEASPSEPEEPKYDPASPKNVLLHEGTVFLLNHRASDIGKKAEEGCEKKSGGDVAKKANCLSTAINKMDREGFMFDEDNDGKWWYIRIGIVKGAKVEYNKVLTEPGEPSGKNIVIKTTGPDTAARKKGTVPAELKFEVPDEYTIILDDPERGKMVFEPKMGLFNGNEQP